MIESGEFPWKESPPPPPLEAGEKEWQRWFFQYYLRIEDQRAKSPRGVVMPKFLAITILAWLFASLFATGYALRDGQSTRDSIRETGRELRVLQQMYMEDPLDKLPPPKKVEGENTP